MRVLGKSAVVKNVIVFVVLSLFYLLVINSLVGGVSAMKWSTFYDFTNQHHFYVGLGLLVILAVVSGFRMSPYVFLTFTCYTAFKSLGAFIIELDKVILALNFIYIVVAYNLYLFLKLELEEPFYNSKYPANIVPAFENRLLPLIIKTQGKSYEYYLTNWGKSGFYCKAAKDSTLVKGKVDIEIDWKGYSFQAAGIVVTSGAGGIGVKIIKNPVPELGWPDFYNIISELGFRPC